MSVIHDWVDWLGGWPFEVATPEELIQFFGKKGFRLKRSILRPNEGNNELVFERTTK